MFLYGWMCGGIIWGIICDRTGRKKAVVFSTGFYAVFTLVTAIAPFWEWVVACRFLSGFGVGGVIVTTTIIISEAWTPGKRPVAIGLLTICFPVGIFLAGAITYLIPERRQAFLIGFVPLALSIISFLLLKEPEEWKKNYSGQSQKKNLQQLFNADRVVGNICLASYMVEKFTY